jgi:hypothetical protein
MRRTMIKHKMVPIIRNPKMMTMMAVTAQKTPGTKYSFDGTSRCKSRSASACSSR